MTTVEMASESRKYLLLSDAMAEANRIKKPRGNEDGMELPTRLVSTRLNGGIRFQRCGGGRRIIRRQRGGN